MFSKLRRSAPNYQVVLQVIVGSNDASKLRKHRAKPQQARLFGEHADAVANDQSASGVRDGVSRDHGKAGTFLN
ncbi:MAG: hypothetical protein ABI791_08560 [Acidobacteriota bacterium]